MNARAVYRYSRWGAAGVSLIEALVALAVMAFGILGVVGMQSTMRAGTDISRQRSEAVRIAQERLEQLRNYSVLLTADKASSSQFAYQEIAASAANVAASHANTTFRLETVVPTVAASDAMAALRQVRVLVSWADRSASVPNQRVELSSAIAPLPAEMSALHAMRTDRSPLTKAYGRHSAIPRVAQDNGNGTSTFTPPGFPTVGWIFDNGTGWICGIGSPSTTSCDYSTLRWLLSGSVAFATGASPTPLEAEAPVDFLPPGVTFSMRVVVLEPAGTADEACAIGTVPGQSRVAYYCAVPMDQSFFYWSGRVEFDTLPFSSALSDNSPTNYKVCRYTPDTANVVPTPPAILPTVPAGQTVGDYNSRHPYIYYRVDRPLQNKNFLVISAGSGVPPAFGCPGEAVPATPIESNTLPHQPIS